MANEIYTGDSGLGAALIAGTLARKIALAQLGDRGSIRNHDALVNLSGTDFAGGAAKKGALHGFGLDNFASRTEIQAIANTAPGSATYTVTPGRNGLRYEVSEWERTVDPTGITDPDAIAQWLPVSYGRTLTNLIAQDGDGLTNVGSTTIDFSHDTWLLGQIALSSAGVTGPYLAVLSGNSFGDWQRDLEQRGGLTQWVPASAAMQQIRGHGFKGTYNGVDACQSAQVQTSNAGDDDANFIFGRGCLGFEEVMLARSPASQTVLLDMGFMRVSEDHSDDTGLTSVTGVVHVGTVVMEAGRGRAFSGAV